MPLSQTERDLSAYSVNKVLGAIRDVAQAFEIAGKPKDEAMVCLCVTLTRASAMIAKHGGIPRDIYLQRVAKMFDDPIEGV